MVLTKHGRKARMQFPYFITKPVVSLPLLIAYVFAVNAPADWVPSARWLSSTINLISTLFPPISGYAKKSAFPGITQTYMAFAFMLMPLHGWYTYRELTTPNEKPWFRNLWTIGSKWAFAKRALLVLVVSASVFFSLFLNPGYDFNLMPLNSSPRALGLGGWIVAGGIQASGLAWVYCNVIVFIRFFRGNGRDEEPLPRA